MRSIVGIDICDEELEAIAAGEDKWEMMQCPSCLGDNTEKRTSVVGTSFWVCLSCGYKWTYD